MHLPKNFITLKYFTAYTH